MYLNFVGLQKDVPPPRQDHPVGGRQEGEPAVVEGGVDGVAAHGAEPRAVLPVEEVRLGRGRRESLLRRESAENITLRQDCTESGLQRAKEIHPTIFYNCLNDILRSLLVPQRSWHEKYYTQHD